MAALWTDPSDRLEQVALLAEYIPIPAFPPAFSTVPRLRRISDAHAEPSGRSASQPSVTDAFSVNKDNYPIKHKTP